MPKPGEVMRPEDDPGWASYADTILVIHGRETVTIDLREVVSGELIDRMARAGLSREFGLVTPCNPRGQEASETRNDELLGRFTGMLDQSGVSYIGVDGWSRDRTRVEQGVALPLTLDEVIELAREWEQSAIYWFDGSSFWVHGALTRSVPWLLPEVAE